MDEQENIQTGASTEPSAEQPTQETAAPAAQAPAEQAAPAQATSADPQGAYQPFGEAAPAQATTEAAQPAATAQPAAAAQPAATAQPTAAAQPAAAAPVPAAAPVAAAPTGVQPSATPALVCGILAIVLCGFPIVGIALGVVAIVLAGKYFRAGGTAGTGKAGRICGIIGIVLSVIMIIVGIAMTMMALTLYGTSSLESPSPSSYSYSSSASSFSYNEYEAADDEERAVYDVMNARLDQIKDQDPEMMAYIANILETSFNDAMADEDMDVTLQTIGVDPLELAKLMVADFAYEPFSVRMDPTDSNLAEANYYVTVRSMSDVEDEFLDRMDDLSSSVRNMTTEEGLAALGQALIDSVKATDPDPDMFIDVDMELVNGAWTIDQKSWDDEMEYFFEFF